MVGLRPSPAISCWDLFMLRVVLKKWRDRKFERRLWCVVVVIAHRRIGGNASPTVLLVAQWWEHLLTPPQCLSRQNTSFVMTKVCLLRQNFCHDKIMFVATKYFCRDEHMFCRDKNTFVVTKHVFCRDKSKLVVTKVLSWQNYLLRQMFVATNCWSRQAYFCRDKRRVLSP